MSKAIEILGKGEEKRKGRVRVELDTPDDLRKAIMSLKQNGFDHFVMLSCVDWIDRGTFQLTYHLWSYRYREHVMLVITIDRNDPVMPSNHDLFPQIETYEREIHEMYGVVFRGNRRLKPFIMENWPHKPPMRKDFDTEKFVKDVYYRIPEVRE